MLNTSQKDRYNNKSRNERNQIDGATNETRQTEQRMKTDDQKKKEKNRPTAQPRGRKLKEKKSALKDECASSKLSTFCIENKFFGF